MAELVLQVIKWVTTYYSQTLITISQKKKISTSTMHKHKERANELA